jgi:hypothetical protein
LESGIADSIDQSERVQAVALRIDWSSLDHAAFHVMRGEGFVINNYGHPGFVRYIEGHRLLTLSYEYVDETAQRGRRYFVFRNYAIHVEVPTKIKWDDGTDLTKREVTTVISRICQTLEAYKRRACVVVVNDRLYDELEAAQGKRRRLQ